MKEYLTEHIRNVAVLGHFDSGKTSLCESILYKTKAIAKKGEIERKNTVSDFLVEEQNKLTSLSTSLIPVEWNGYKINFLDTPGSEEFVGEIQQDLAVVKGAVVVIDAQKGIEVGTERVWDELQNRHTPTILFINKVDKENIKFRKLIDDIKEKFGSNVVPFIMPVMKDGMYDGYIDIIKKKAFIGDDEVESEIPAIYQAKLEDYYDKFVETVAGQDEELMEKYFAGEELTEEELIHGLRSALLNCDIFPVMIGSGTKNYGITELLDKICWYLPSPQDLKPAVGADPKTGAEILKTSHDEEPFSAYIFKTAVDPFLGTINYFKIY